MLPSPETSPSRPPIDWGWVVVGHLDPPDRQGVELAIRACRETLETAFPQYEWCVDLVEREAPMARTREEPAELLEVGVVERSARRWDFALVLTGGELRTYYRPWAMGAPSRSLGVAVASTSRIDPRARGRSLSDDERAEVIARRVHALALHLFGHLAGLDHSAEPTDFMSDLRTVHDLDRIDRYGEETSTELSAELADVADLRLEETSTSRSGIVSFYLRAMIHTAGDIASSILKARPWSFPFHLSRLTTAAMSGLLILLITAEVWDLGKSQAPLLVASFSLFVLVTATGYVVHRQRLLVRRDDRRMTEQKVMANVAVTLIVFLGLVTTYGILFTLTLVLASMLYPPGLVTSWATSLEAGVHAQHYLVLAGFVAALGIVIGSLGASFEENLYVRHIAYVDEET